MESNDKAATPLDTGVSDYTVEQVERWESYVALPPKYRRSASPAHNLEYLTVLFVHQISTIPFENLALHYSQRHVITLEPQLLYEKLTKNGRGGYCMENSIFFNRILRRLGFQVYLVGARVSSRVNGIPTGKFFGWVHSVNIVTLADGSKYMLDVSFGGDGPTKPLPLVEHEISHNLGTQEVRLIQGNIPQQMDTSYRFWLYQYRNDPSRDWSSFYCFTEMEFTQGDFEVMNHFTSTSPASYMINNIVVVKFLRYDSKIGAKLMLVNNEMKSNESGKTFVLQTFRTEEERLSALSKFFQITITDEEARGIRGMETELK